jgi:hypothetical protein
MTFSSATPYGSIQIHRRVTNEIANMNFPDPPRLQKPHNTIGNGFEMLASACTLRIHGDDLQLLCDANVSAGTGSTASPRPRHLTDTPEVILHILAMEKNYLNSRNWLTTSHRRSCGLLVLQPARNLRHSLINAISQYGLGTITESPGRRHRSSKR